MKHKEYEEKVATPGDVIKLVDQIKRSGRFFTIMFVKHDNTLRLMNCRTGVKKHLHGGTLKYRAAEKGLLTVWDRQKGEYRSANFNTVRWIRFAGVQYKFMN